MESAWREASVTAPTVPAARGRTARLRRVSESADDRARAHAWYRLDATALSLRECWRITRAIPTLLRIRSSRRRGRPFLVGPPLTDAPPVEIGSSEVAPGTLQELVRVAGDLEPLGFAPVATFREWQLSPRLEHVV